MNSSAGQATSVGGPHLTRRLFLGESSLALSALIVGKSRLPRLPRPRARSKPEGSEQHWHLISAATDQAGYVALATHGEGAALFRLQVGVTGAVSLGQPLGSPLPPTFVPASLTVAETGLFVSGWVPFTLERHSYTDSLDGIPAEERIFLPLDYVPRGVYEVEVMGLRPAVFRIDAGGAHSVGLPPLPGSPPIAAVTDIANPTADDLVLLVEHSSDSEAVYAAAATVVQRIEGRWSVTALARDLGESGPNSLAAAQGRVVVGLTPSGESSTVYEKSMSASQWVRGPQFREPSLVLAIAAQPSGGSQAFTRGSDERLHRWVASPGADKWIELAIPPGLDNANMRVLPVRG